MTLSAARIYSVEQKKISGGLFYHAYSTTNYINIKSYGHHLCDTYSLPPNAYWDTFLGGKRGVKVKMTTDFSADILHQFLISHMQSTFIANATLLALDRRGFGKSQKSML
jgi:hypothetical protein